MLALLRSAVTDEKAASPLRDFLSRVLLTPVAQVAGEGYPSYVPPSSRRRWSVRPSLAAPCASNRSPPPAPTSWRQRSVPRWTAT